jgi:hypothetical protein
MVYKLQKSLYDLNGFKYETYTNLKITIKVLKLYPFVYHKQEITNNIVLSFVKALLVDRKKIKMKWAHFVEHVGGMEVKVHKVRPLNNEAKKKVLSNVVITRDGSKEGLLPLKDHVMVKPPTVENELSPKKHPIGLELQTCHKGSGMFKKFWMLKLKRFPLLKVKSIFSRQSKTSCRTTLKHNMERFNN